ncbi:MAG: phosphoglucosamine mutase [Actinomycetota bacterium]|nr:phosphoglucosamine mutase [Actinomycetota bacterium]
MSASGTSAAQGGTSPFQAGVARLRFGTDGIRGPDTELTPELAVALGRAAATVLAPRPGDRLVIGRDTRRSGSMLESALAAGLAAHGVVVERLGVLPTPGVAWVAANEKVPGAMISASHNVFSDNGIKFFAAGGHKLSDQAEARLEGELHRRLLDGPLAATAGAGAVASVVSGAAVGTVSDRDDIDPGYADHLLACLEGRRLDGLSVVLDPAHGAAAKVGPEVLARTGAEVHVVHGSPDGVNINAGCGSTYPEGLARAVVDSGADLGLALDGDADRMIAVDHRGGLVDGDQIIALLAADLLARGRLRGSTVVITVMSNLGLRHALAAHGVSVVETPVGDRHVLAALERGGWSLGGEQSGHVILHDLATTGDGLLTGLLVADLVRRSGASLADLAAAAMTRLPQVLRSVAVPRRDPAILEQLAGPVAALEAELGDGGRVLVRPSGTEPVVRVMVEAPTVGQADALADRLVAEVQRVSLEAGH